MANYLERVASSAGRRAAVAKPPASGPPVLPPGRDISIAAVDPFAGDEEQFVETIETRTPLRTEERVEFPAAAKVESPKERKTAATQNETLTAAVEPQPKPRPVQERLSSDSPFTVSVPRTLRPGVTPKVPPMAEEQPREPQPPRASTTVGPEEFTIAGEPAPVVRSTEPVVNEISEPVAAEADTTGFTPQPKQVVGNRADEHQAPVRTEAALTDAAPAPRVDRVDGPARFALQPAEPSPPPASPVHLPPVAASTSRPEQSRISIGSLEVLVNNHPRATPVQPAAAPSRSESLNLEKRYLDRFRLRH